MRILTIGSLLLTTLFNAISCSQLTTETVVLWQEFKQGYTGLLTQLQAPQIQQAAHSYAGLMSLDIPLPSADYLQQINQRQAYLEAATCPQPQELISTVERILEEDITLFNAAVPLLQATPSNTPTLRQHLLQRASIMQELYNTLNSNLDQMHSWEEQEKIRMRQYQTQQAETAYNVLAAELFSRAQKLYPRAQQRLQTTYKEINNEAEQPDSDVQRYRLAYSASCAQEFLLPVRKQQALLAILTTLQRHTETVDQLTPVVCTKNTLLRNYLADLRNEGILEGAVAQTSTPKMKFQVDLQSLSAQLLTKIKAYPHPRVRASLEQLCRILPTQIEALWSTQPDAVHYATTQLQQSLQYTHQESIKTSQLRRQACEQAGISLQFFTPLTQQRAYTDTLATLTTFFQLKLPHWQGRALGERERQQHSEYERLQQEIAQMQMILNQMHTQQAKDVATPENHTDELLNPANEATESALQTHAATQTSLAPAADSQIKPPLNLSVGQCLTLAGVLSLVAASLTHLLSKPVYRSRRNIALAQKKSAERESCVK
jgi:hypothetical protein